MVETMIALCDSGNSQLHFGWWVDGAVTGALSVPYPDSLSELTGTIARFIGDRAVRKAAACSVNSRWRDRLFISLNDATGGGLHVATSAADVGLTVAYDDQSSYGIDRALAAVAAYRHFHGACVLIDIGTAVTVDAVAADGTVKGGYIFPGIQALSRCLSGATDLPTAVTGDMTAGIGTSTGSCMTFGVSMGLIGAIERLVRFAEKTVGSGDRIMLTGGGAQALAPLLSFTAVIRPFLVLEGLGLSLDRIPKYA